jgi:hypothetical protein
MASIEKRTSHGRPVLYAKVRLQGQAKSTPFHSLGGARAWGRTVEVALLNNRYLLLKQTLCQVIDHYRTAVAPHVQTTLLVSRC